MSDLELPSFKREETIIITKEEAPFAPEEQLGEYTLRRLSWYEKQRAVARSQEIIDATRGITRMSVEDYFAEMLLATVREYPESLRVKVDTSLDPTAKTETGWTLNFIKMKLDIDIGDTLRDICRDINGLTEKERKLFLPRSEQDEATPT